MLAVAVAALALLPMLPAQEGAPPAPESESESESVPAPVVESEPPPVESAPAPLESESAPAVDEKKPDAQLPDACLALLQDGKRDEAQRCYAERARGDGDDARLARELADVVGSLELRPPSVELEVPSGGTTPSQFDVGGLFLTGKAELIATSTLVGAYMATVATTGGLAALCNTGSCGGPIAATVLVAPVAGGGLGLGVSTATMLAMSDLSAGDVNAVRAVMLLGTFDSILLSTASMSSFGSNNGAVVLTTFGMFATQAAGVGAGIAVAAFTELPEGAGSLALSAGLWTSVIGVLGANMFGAMRNASPQGVSLFLFGTANLGFVGGMVASPYFPMSRAETWAIDIGGAVGLLAGASLAFQTKAPNPFIGWGTMALGTGIGMGAGFAAARYLPEMVGGLPEVVAFAPIVDDDVTGAMIAGRF